jgi:hypothetical protein
LTAPPRPRRVSAVTAVTRSDGPQFTHFVGREAEVATLEQTLAETRSGRPPVAVITGDAGLGKSRLAERLATRRGARARWSWPVASTTYVGSRPPPLEAFLAMIADRTRPAVERQRRGPPRSRSAPGSAGPRSRRSPTS